jgi:hypothetical protein
METPDLTGLWHSEYGYGGAVAAEQSRSYHDLDLDQDKASGLWLVKSRPNEEGSAVTMSLEFYLGQLIGNWYERTSPKGKFGGVEFRGAVVLLPKSNENGVYHLEGQWVGANRSGTRVNNGPWTLTR